MCAHFGANLASKFVFFNFLFTPAEFRFHIFLDYISKLGNLTHANPKPAKEVVLQDSSGFSPTERKFLADSLSAQLQVGRLKQGRGGDKSLAAVLAEFRFDLRPQTAGSWGGGAGAEAQTPERGGKVITPPPPLLMCDRQHASAAEAEANHRVNCNFASAAP